MERMIQTMPPGAIQVLRHASSRPYTALGVERLAEPCELNTVNRRLLLKRYRQLALELHPDRCDHTLACDAMQALNLAFERTQRPSRCQVKG